MLRVSASLLDCVVSLDHDCTVMTLSLHDSDDHVTISELEEDVAVISWPIIGASMSEPQLCAYILHTSFRMFLML